MLDGDVPLRLSCSSLYSAYKFNAHGARSLRVPLRDGPHYADGGGGAGGGGWVVLGLDLPSLIAEHGTERNRKVKPYQCLKAIQMCSTMVVSIGLGSGSRLV